MASSIGSHKVGIVTSATLIHMLRNKASAAHLSHAYSLGRLANNFTQNTAKVATPATPTLLNSVGSRLEARLLPRPTPSQYVRGRSCNAKRSAAIRLKKDPESVLDKVFVINVSL